MRPAELAAGQRAPPLVWKVCLQACERTQPRVDEYVKMLKKSQSTYSSPGQSEVSNGW